MEGDDFQVLIIKAKFKDLVLISDLKDELEWIVKYTNMLKDDPDAEITIKTQLEKPIFRSEYEELKSTGVIYIERLDVRGQIKNRWEDI